VSGESLRELFIVCINFLQLGCASIISGSSQETTFRRQPDGATVTVGEKIYGKTLLTVNLKIQSNQHLTFEEEGCRTQAMQLSATLNSWFWGNIAAGGDIGLTTDGLSGAAHEY